MAKLLERKELPDVTRRLKFDRGLEAQIAACGAAVKHGFEIRPAVLGFWGSKFSALLTPINSIAFGLFSETCPLPPSNPAKKF